MPAPGIYTWADDIYVSAHQAVVANIDAGASFAYWDILDQADTVLATLLLDDPCATVNGTTGQITFSFTGGEVGLVTGTASWARMYDSDGNPKLWMPTAVGTVAVSGFFVMNTTSIILGAPVGVASATVG